MPAVQSLVIVDADPRSRGAIAYGFEREGCAVRASADGREALAHAEKLQPQLVVASSTSTGGVDAVGFARALRASSAAGDVPLVVVGERARRPEVLAAGADEYLSRPAFIRDVVTLGRLAVAMRSQTLDTDGATAELEGNLADYGLYFLTRAISAASRSGVLVLERQKRTADLRFSDGELISARVGKQSGANAFLHLLLWESARFHLRFGDPKTTRKINKPVDRLLEDGLRFVSEFEAIADRVGGTQVVYRQDEERIAANQRQIPPEVQQLVGNYDGKRPLIDVIEDSPFKPFDTVMITYRLAEMNSIVRVHEPKPSPMAAKLEVRDWLLGTSPRGEPAVTLTEGGRIVPDSQPVIEATPPAGPAPQPPPVAVAAAAPPRKKPIAPPHADISSDVTMRVPLVRAEDVAPTVEPRPAVTVAPTKSWRNDETPLPRPAPAMVTPTPPATAKSASAAKATPAATPASRSNSGRHKHIEGPRSGDSGPHQRIDFDSLDEEFFAGEAELFRVPEVENFDDLEAAVAEESKKPGWFSFGRPSATGTPPSQRTASTKPPARKTPKR